MLCLCHSSHTFPPSLDGSKKIAIGICRISIIFLKNRVNREFSIGLLLEWISLAVPLDRKLSATKPTSSKLRAAAEESESSLFQVGEERQRG